MNIQAIYHRPESNYCFSLTDKKIGLRIRFAKGEKIDSVSVIYNNKYYIAVKQYAKELDFTCSDGTYDYYSTVLELMDSRFSYIFEIEFDDKKIYYCEVGVKEEYDFNYAYYDSFQYAYLNQNDIIANVDWLNNGVFYQIFVDRFAKGSIKDESYINCQWNDLPTPKSFHGGDLDGIADNLDYIQNLGVTAIYLTPVFKSISNHKYDISDYYQVDEMFGGNIALKRLVTECHNRGLKIILDAVFNHVSENFEPFQDVLQKGNESKYFDWFMIDGPKVNTSKNNYACFAACNYMPKLNTNNPEVQQYLLNVVEYWMKEYDIDGWRLDVADEVSHDFWRLMRRTVKSIKKDAALIGENWHNSESYLNGDQFDSIMNYGVLKAMLDYWVNESLDEQGLSFALNRQLMRYADTTNNMMFNLIDSHDTYRFLTEVKGNQDKLICALVTLAFLPGSLNLYYGTEILLEGGFDPDSRRAFDFNRLDDEKVHLYFNIISFILKLKQQPALKNGKVTISEQNGMLVIERASAEQVLTLKVSKQSKKIENNFSMSFNNKNNYNDNLFIIEGKLR